MDTSQWYLLVGAILMTMAVSASILKRMPLSTAILYLAVGISIGPMFGGYFHFNPLKQSALFEKITEVAVLISLYSAGLKLQASFLNPVWRIAIRLATVSVVCTIFFVTALGMYLLDMSFGEAVLLGAILAPTDPVLATDIQVNNHLDRDRLRFSLTGEAAINDGTAFPFVMLGLGLIGFHNLGADLSRWLLVDLLWGTVCGIGVGIQMGMLTAIIVNHLSRLKMCNEFMNNFLGLGLISVSYGFALMLHGYGFLAVFFAAFTLRQTESLLCSRTKMSKTEYLEKIGIIVNSTVTEKDEILSQRILHFNEQLERLVEVVLIVLIGGMLFRDSWMFEYILFAAVLLFVIRPASIFVTLAHARIPPAPLLLTSWFGIRGIGSMYYLMFVIQQGIPEHLSVQLISVVLITVTLSIILHGVSATPLMNWYSRNGRYWRMIESTAYS
jgi:NhaP-type Na+/H+ or K+/H+ antiporter